MAARTNTEAATGWVVEKLQYQFIGEDDSGVIYREQGRPTSVNIRRFRRIAAFTGGQMGPIEVRFRAASG